MRKYLLIICQFNFHKYILANSFQNVNNENIFIFRALSAPPHRPFASVWHSDWGLWFFAGTKGF